MPRHQDRISIERVIGIAEKDLRPPIAPLGDMMRQTADDGAGHAPIGAGSALSLNQMHCHRNLKMHCHRNLDVLQLD